MTIVLTTFFPPLSDPLQTPRQVPTWARPVAVAAEAAPSQRSSSVPHVRVEKRWGWWGNSEHQNLEAIFHGKKIGKIWRNDG